MPQKISHTQRRFPEQLGQQLSANSVSIVPASDALPIPVSSSPLAVKETRYHDTAAITINNNAGAFVEVAGGPAIANTIFGIHITCTLGEPLQFRKGANAAAAAANPDLCIVNRGEQNVEMGISLIAGDRLWVRTLTAINVANSGEIAVNLLG